MALAVVNSSLRRRERFVPYLFILPALIGLLTFEISPFFEAFSETLNPPNAITGITHFVGLGEYRVLFSDPNFTHSILVTLLFAALVNPIQVAISLLLALAVLKKGVRSSVFRVLYFLPVGSSLTVASVIWGVILSPNGGLANGLLHAAHLPSQQFFSSPHEALWSIILLASWNGCGYWMVFFLAGLNEIDPLLYEAASVDGAGVVAKFFHVTMPSLTRMMAFVFVADTVSNFLLFAPVFILTEGGPSGSTNLLMYYAYAHAFADNELGLGLAASIILLIVVMAFVIVELRMMRGEAVE